MGVKGQTYGDSRALILNVLWLTIVGAAKGDRSEFICEVDSRFHCPECVCVRRRGNGRTTYCDAQ